MLISTISPYPVAIKTAHRVLINRGYVIRRAADHDLIYCQKQKNKVKTDSQMHLNFNKKKTSKIKS